MGANFDSGDDCCPFCEIVEWDDPEAREVYRDENTVAFFPTDPAVLGHTMVIPRAHVADIWEISEDQAKNVAATVLRIASVIRATLRPAGLNVIQSNGVAASQSVMHLHVHLVPRTAGDRIGRIWPPESSYSEAQKDKTWELLRQACRTIDSEAR